MLNYWIPSLNLSRSVVPLSICLLLAGSAVPAAADLSPQQRERLEAAGIDGALIEALAQKSAVYVEILLVSPSASDTPAKRPAQGTAVQPLVSAVAKLAAGERVEVRRQEGFVSTLAAWLDADAVLALAADPDVLGISLTEPVSEAASGGLSSLTMAASSCSPSSTVACFHGGRFSVSVTHNGTASKVAAASSESAAFWTFASANWEVLVKVLNGCSNNNRYWVFAAGATSLSYSITVQDHVRGLILFYPNVGCPLTDTAAFPC